MKGAWIATIILLACSVSFGDHASEWVSYQRVDERECCELRAEQPVWENERNLPGQLPDCHELYPWQELPDIEFDHHSDFTRELPDIEFDHHSDITREMPDLEFDGGWSTSPYAEVSIPEIQETSRGEPENGVGQARATAQANPPVQARTPGQSRPPAELDGGPNEDALQLATSRSEETSCRRPVTEAVGSPNLSRSKPPVVLDHNGDDSTLAWPNIESDGGEEAKSLPPKLAW